MSKRTPDPSLIEIVLSLPGLPASLPLRTVRRRVLLAMFIGFVCGLSLCAAYAPTIAGRLCH